MTPAGLAFLKVCEACRLRGYADPITHGAPYACGWGCTGPGIGPDTVWTLSQAELELAKRVQQTEGALQHALPWFAHLQIAFPVRADSLVNIAFNVGVRGLTEWPVTDAAVARGDYAGAAADITGNLKWVGQVHVARANGCAHAMATNSWNWVARLAPGPAPVTIHVSLPDISASQAATRAALEA